MHADHARYRNRGFALVEAVLIVLVIAALVGIGAYVVQHRTSTLNSSSTGNTSASNNGSGSNSSAVPANGTTASVDALTQADANSESGVDTKADTQAQQDAGSANTAVSNVGGAYNETTF